MNEKISFCQTGTTFQSFGDQGLNEKAMPQNGKEEVKSFGKKAENQQEEILHINNYLMGFSYNLIVLQIKKRSI